MSKDNLKLFCHLLGGLIIIVLAFQFFESNMMNLSIAHIIIGCLFIILAGVHKWLEGKVGRFILIFFLIEAAVFWNASKTPLEEDDLIVTDLIQLAAIGYVLLAGFFFFVGDNKPRKHRKRRRRKPGNLTTNNPAASQ